MKQKLKKLLKNSYSPYSNVKVSAIVIANNNEYVGVNVENSAYPSGLCAERNAINSAISQGAKIKTIKEIHIHSNVKRPLFPCGACLQVMNETLAKNAKIFIYGNDNTIVTNMDELLPQGISKESFAWK